MTRFDGKPFIVIWEMTQSCDLACKHCRACARPARDPEELSTAEAKTLIDSLADAQVPLLVFTGGDPAKREDLVELVGYAKSRGLKVGLTPSATPLVTDTLIDELAAAGLSRLAVSIDGPTAEVHDAFRGVEGSFDLAFNILRAGQRCSIHTQINTSVHAGNIHLLPQMAAMVRRSGVFMWSVFFVVPTGRAQATMLPSATAVEEALELLADLAEREPFAIKTTAAPHYRRVLMQRKQAARHGVHGMEAIRVNEGRGFMFVSHRGEIFPSGFLPIPCGNVRKVHPIETYRSHPVFRALRDTTALTGKCGACQYRNVCGGSRARAYAMTKNYLESDALCSYVPPGYEGPLPGATRHLTVLSR